MAEDKKWLFINKTGSFWGGDCVVDVENFVRGENPEKPNQGQVSWRAKFKEKPQFDQRPKSQPGGLFAPKFVCNGFASCDQEDYKYFAAAGREFRDGGPWRMNKWALSTSCSIEPVGRGQQFGPFEVHVFANGTALCDYDKEPKEDGTQAWKKNVHEFVEQLCYQIVQVNTGAVIASWAVPGDFEAVDKLVQQNPVFELTLVGGWMNKKPVVKTAHGWDPLLALLIAYLIAYEYSPGEIKSDLKSDFPHAPW